MTSVPTDSAISTRAPKQGEHTPGPWFALEVNASGAMGDFLVSSNVDGSGNDLGTTKNDGIRIARCPRSSDSEANARLIAAAPDMLAALELAADYIKELDGGDQRSHTGWKSEELLGVWMKAQEAIAKATASRTDERTTSTEGLVPCSTS